jgi:glycosyltransferase involved in cell wall biosynthesis
MNPTRPRWTISILTIPERESYLKTLLASIAALPGAAGLVVDVIYNRDTREAPTDVEERVRGLVTGLQLNVYFNPTNPTIGAARIQQLNHCKTPLVAFLDDDLTLHGDAIASVEEELRRLPVAAVGLRSYVEDTDQLFKPRTSTPSVDAHGMRFMPVQGMLVAGYRRLFLDVGGFNPRREFWGEWTELNMRLWRSGFPTGYAMSGAFLRHWERAPASPTRSMVGREENVLWGLMCTALEYDAIAEGPETTPFWDLIESRYIAYSFGADVRIRDVLRTALRLTPRMSAMYPQIAAFRDTVRQHPFDFKPFHAFTSEEVAAVLAHAAARIGPYRADAWGGSAD